jgi:hypothetical protein
MLNGIIGYALLVVLPVPLAARHIVGVVQEETRACAPPVPA